MPLSTKKPRPGGFIICRRLKVGKHEKISETMPRAQITPNRKRNATLLLFF